ncbi:hypothetical protein GTW51_18010 [Aurantimonas aggregata]|uniref:Uncharacterized protein n=1 Tax=Aurantimonas aggregata TaxID=2047720 RepID=A0A6L9MM44_9HYPH|nr:hypothetical protein [Aurantimonas aggregata]NDV88600.1 hypothetical protein [Aurantimonas aggregata]
MLGECLDRTDDAFWEPVMDEICSVAFARLPMSSTGHFMQRRPPKRLVHSIVSAAEEYGLNVSGTRRYLRRADVIGPETDALPPDKVTFPADALPPRRKLLEQRHRPGEGLSTDGPVSVTEAAALLGIGAKYMAGCDFLLADRQNGRWRQFDQRKVASLRHAMLSGAVLVNEAGPEDYGIEEVARRCHVTFAALVGYVEAGEVSWKGRLAKSQSLEGLLFRKSEIYRILFPMEEGEIELRIAADRMGYDKGILYRLVKDGHLPARQRINGRGGPRGWVVRLADVETLMGQTMRFDEVAAALSMKKQQAKRALKADGIVPIFEDARVGTVLFWRQEVEQHLASSISALNR